MSTMVGNWKMAIADGCMAGDQLNLFNISPGNAYVELTFCAEGGQPLGPFRVPIPAQRTHSLALEDLVDPDTLSAESVVLRRGGLGQAGTRSA